MLPIDKVNRLGLGGLPLQRIPFEEAVSVVEYAYERGINFYDTSQAYGISEEVLAAALYPVRKEVVICTKTQKDTFLGIVEDFTNSCGLFGGYIDIFMLHNIKSIKELQDKLELSKRFLDDQMRLERLRYFGVSSHRMDVIFEALKHCMVSWIMIPFNHVEKHPQSILISAALRKGIGVICMKPLGGDISHLDASLRWIAAQFPELILVPEMKSKEDIDKSITALKHH